MMRYSTARSPIVRDMDASFSPATWTAVVVVLLFLPMPVWAEDGRTGQSAPRSSPFATGRGSALPGDAGLYLAQLAQEEGTDAGKKGGEDERNEVPETQEEQQGASETASPKPKEEATGPAEPPEPETEIEIEFPGSVIEVPEAPPTPEETPQSGEGAPSETERSEGSGETESEATGTDEESFGDFGDFGSDSFEFGETETFQPTVSVRAIYQTKLAVDLKKENDIEDILEFRNRFLAESKATLSDAVQFQISGLIDYNVLVGSRVESVETGDGTSASSTTSSQGAQTEPPTKTRINTDARPDLYEAFVDIHEFPWALSVGKQLVTWGRSDAFSPVNFINPGDFRELIFSEFEPNVPTFLLRGEYSFSFHGSHRLEAVYIPFFEEAKLNIFGDDYSILQSGLLNATTAENAEIFNSLNLALRTFNFEFTERLQPALRATDFPEDNFLASEIGFRSLSTFRGFDVELDFLSTYNDVAALRFDEALAEDLAVAYDTDTGAPGDGPETITQDELNEIFANLLQEILQEQINNPDPQLFIDQVNSLIRSDYQRYHIAGGGVSTTFGPVGARAEGAFSLGTPVLNTDFELRRINIFTWTGSFDYTLPLIDMLLLAQFYQRVLLVNDPENLLLENSITGKVLSTIVTNLRGNYLRDRLTVDIRSLFIIDTRDLYLSPRLSFDFTDEITLTMGLNLLEARNPPSNDPEDFETGKSIFQTLTSLDQIFLYMRYTF